MAEQEKFLGLDISNDGSGLRKAIEPKAPEHRADRGDGSWPPPVDVCSTTPSTKPDEPVSIPSALLLGIVCLLWYGAVASMTSSSVTNPSLAPHENLVWGAMAITAVGFTVGGIAQTFNRAISLKILRWSAIVGIAAVLVSVFPTWYDTLWYLGQEEQGLIPGEHPMAFMNVIGFWVGMIVDSVQIVYCVKVILKTDSKARQ